MTEDFAVPPSLTYCSTLASHENMDMSSSSEPNSGLKIKEWMNQECKGFELVQHGRARKSQIFGQTQASSTFSEGTDAGKVSYRKWRSKNR